MKIIICFLLISYNTYSKNIDFDWIIGDWSEKINEDTFIENWQKIDDDNYIGVEYYLAGSDTTMKANLKLQKMIDTWIYIAYVEGQQPVLYTLVEDNGKYVFENLEHDFPQKIEYNIQDEYSILASIEGNLNGEIVKEEYNLKKNDSE